MTDFDASCIKQLWLLWLIYNPLKYNSLVTAYELANSPVPRTKEKEEELTSGLKHNNVKYKSKFLKQFSAGSSPAFLLTYYGLNCLEEQQGV